MDEQLKAYLDNLMLGLGQLRGELAPIRGDLAQLRGDLAQLGGDLAQLRGDLAQTKQELREHTEAVETRLLGEFWKWARTADARYRQSTAIVGSLDDRVQAVEDRVAELERRKAS